MDVGNVDVSEEHAASIFRVEVNRVGECSCIYFLFIYLISNSIDPGG
jgi:hypothetical protein